MDDWVIAALIIIAAVIAVVAVSYLWIKWRAAAHIFTRSETLPLRETGLVLGTARLTAAGADNRYFTGRMDAARVLFECRGVGRLILSGGDRCSGAKEEEESEAMQKALLGRGIPAGQLVCDSRGYRTWYSMQRCFHEYGCPDPIVVSQRFHVERAVFIGLHLGMRPVGFAAARIGGRVAVRMFFRECLARVRCLIDCLVWPPVSDEKPGHT